MHEFSGRQEERVVMIFLREAGPWGLFCCVKSYISNVPTFTNKKRTDLLVNVGTFRNVTFYTTDPRNTKTSKRMATAKRHLKGNVIYYRWINYVRCSTKHLFCVHIRNICFVNNAHPRCYRGTCKKDEFQMLLRAAFRTIECSLWSRCEQGMIVACLALERWIST